MTVADAISATYRVCEMYHWAEISNIPSSPGVYAWYYEVNISEKDITFFKDRIENAKNKENGKPIKVVKSFLEEKVFKFFKEKEYKVDIYGELKPSYRGSLSRDQDGSTSLSKRILENPSRIEVIKKYISDITPNFSSPLYIGKSDNLKRRLKSHKRMIRNRKKGEIYNEEEPEEDRNFADRVVKNSMQPSFLYVETKVVEEGDINLDVENILNRISFPIFGRR